MLTEGSLHNSLHKHTHTPCNELCNELCNECAEFEWSTWARLTGEICTRTVLRTTKVRQTSRFLICVVANAFGSIPFDEWCQM